MFFQLRLFACMHRYSCCPHLNCMGLAKSKCMFLILKKRNPGTGEVSDDCLVICPCCDWSSFHTCICWICEKSCMRYLIYLTCQLTLKKSAANYGAEWVYHVQPPTLPRWHPHQTKSPFPTYVGSSTGTSADVKTVPRISSHFSRCEKPLLCSVTSRFWVISMWRTQASHWSVSCDSPSYIHWHHWSGLGTSAFWENV